MEWLKKLGAQKRSWGSIALFVLMIAILIAAWFIAQMGNEKADRQPVQKSITLEEGWVDSQGNSVTLPLKTPYRQEGYTFSTTFELESGMNQSLLFSSKYMNIRLYLNDEELGSCLCQPAGEERTIGKVLAFFPLPQGLTKGTLRMEIEPLLGAGADYDVKAPQIGTGGQLARDMILQEIPILGLASSIFCFGIFLLIYGIQLLFNPVAQNGKSRAHIDFLQIGLFALLFSFYTLLITDTVFLFWQNSYGIYVLEFLLMAVLPLPLLGQAATVCKPFFKKILAGCCCALLLNALLQMGFHLFAGMEFRLVVRWSHGLMVLSAVLLVLAITVGSRKEPGRWWLPLSFFPVLLGGLLDIFYYYMPVVGQKAVGFQLGVLSFLLLQSMYLIHMNLSYYKDYLKSNVYRQMAYTDVLTGIGNRASFEKKLTETQEKLSRYSSLWCISIDINNLKQTNDTLGHSAGDELIRAMARILKDVSQAGASIFRTGGDEFILLLFNQSQQEIQEWSLRFRTALEAYSREGLELSASLGCSQLIPGGEDTVQRLISRADGLMYEDKRRWKAENEPRE